MTTGHLLFLTRAMSEVKKELHNHKLDIVNVKHEGNTTNIEFELPKNFDLIEFQTMMRSKYIDVF